MYFIEVFLGTLIFIGSILNRQNVLYRYNCYISHLDQFGGQASWFTYSVEIYIFTMSPPPAQVDKENMNESISKLHLESHKKVSVFSIHRVQ